MVKASTKTLNFREGEAPVRYDLMTPDLNEATTSSKLWGELSKATR